MSVSYFRPGTKAMPCGSLLILDRRHPTKVSVEIGVARDRHEFRDGTSPFVQPKVV